VTITDKGDDVCTKLLKELIAHDEIANLNKSTDSHDMFKVKRVKFGAGCPECIYC
jgi:hypothetical protein